MGAGFRITPNGLSLGGTITGNLIITGTLNVQGAVTFDVAQTTTGLFNAEGGILIDETGTEVFLVRKEADGGDVFIVDSTNDNIEIPTGQLGFGSVLDYSKVNIGGSFTSGGASNQASLLGLTGTLTGLSGDTGDLSQVIINANTVTQASDTITTIASLFIVEPTITLTGGATVTRAATLFISGAPDEGSENYAIYTDAGDVKFTGKMVVGPQLVVDHAILRVAGNFTSGGAALHAEALQIDSNLTGISGDTTSLSQLRISQGSITTQATDTVAVVASLYVLEPNITVGGGGTVTNAASIYVVNAPDEGSENYAILVNSGDVRFNGALTVWSTQFIDVASTEAFLVRDFADDHDVFTVDTTADTVSVNGGLEITNEAEGKTANITRTTAHETHTLSLSTSSVTTTLAIPSGATLLGASLNINTAITDDDGDDTYTAAFSGGSTTNIAPGSSNPAQNQKINTMIVPEIATATTEVTFTPQGTNFTAGIVEIVVYYEVLTSLANV